MYVPEQLCQKTVACQSAVNSHAGHLESQRPHRTAGQAPIGGFFAFCVVSGVAHQTDGPVWPPVHPNLLPFNRPR